MKGQKTKSLLIYIFHTATTLWAQETRKTVTGLFSKDCILPCHFPPEDDEVIYWKKGDKYVHSYYYQSDHLENQDPDYRHRTQLFYQNIPSGNASLKLSNLTVTDEGLYNCYVGTQKTRTEVEVMLHVRVSPYYALEYQKTDTERMLKCYAFLTYPVPRCILDARQYNYPRNTSGETRVGVLYSLRSDQKILNTADPYSCHINLSHEEWKAEWKMQDPLSSVEGSSTAIPCEYSNITANTEGLIVVWTLNKNAVILVLASFNGTSHSYQPRVEIDQDNFSLKMHDLTPSDSGEYLCNISTPHNTELTVRTLQVENSSNTQKTVLGVIIPVIITVAGAHF